VVDDLPLGTTKLRIKAEDIMGQTRTVEHEILVYAGGTGRDNPINYDDTDPADFGGAPYSDFGVCT